MKPFWWLCVAVLLPLTFAGCHAMPSSNDRRSTEFPNPEAGYSNQVNHWPLVFRAHWFGVRCYSTYACTVRYGHFSMDDPEDKLQLSSASLGDVYPDGVMRAGWGPIVNFPPPAVVRWRSADGTPHHAEIDIGAIFKDQLVRHRTPREDIGKTYDAQPQIILEVNDRTINVYMRAHVSTKALQKPDNPYSNGRSDLVKVYSQNY